VFCSLWGPFVVFDSRGILELLSPVYINTIDFR
jgi:hypothetical protein